MSQDFTAIMPFMRLCGIAITSATAGEVKGTLPWREELCTTAGVIHGGALMAFADTLGAVGTFVNLPEGKRTTTVESSTKFIGAAKVGSTVSGECVALHRGRTTMVWQTRITSDAGKLCGVVTQTQLVIDAA